MSKVVPVSTLSSMLAVFAAAVGAHYGWWAILGGVIAGVLLGASHAYAAAFG